MNLCAAFAVFFILTLNARSKKSCFHRWLIYFIIGTLTRNEKATGEAYSTAMKYHLPAEIIRRKKRGIFVSPNDWLRGALPDFARDMLSDSILKEKGYFQPAFVSAFLDYPN